MSKYCKECGYDDDTHKLELHQLLGYPPVEYRPLTVFRCVEEALKQRIIPLAIKAA